MSKLSKKYSSHPYILIIAGLTVVTLLTTLSGILHYNHELARNSPAKGYTNLTTQESLPNADNEVASAAANDQPTSSTQPISQTNSTSNNKQQISKPGSGQNTAAFPASPGTQTPQQQTTVDISLSVNGSYKGIVKLAPGSNHCDVLSRALSGGLISGLDMRYSTQYKSYAVYVIDGIGDRGSVWWTYRVNGSAPPYGCGGLRVQNGDSVNWQYVKN